MQLSEWGRLSVLFSGVFVVAGTLFLMKWRRPLRTILIVAGVALAIFIPVSLYCYYHSQFSLIIFWDLLLAVWVLAVFFFAQYRDARTIFGLLSIIVFNLCASLLVIVCSYLIPQGVLRLPAAILIHLFFCFSLHAYVRKSYWALAELGKRGWWFACLLPALTFVLLMLIANSPQPLSHRPQDMPLAALFSLTVIIVYLVAARLTTRFLEQKKREKLLMEMSAQMQLTQKELQEMAVREKDSAILRHDLRHFTSLISSCLEAHLYEEALGSVRGLLEHPAMREPEIRYCENPTLNTLLSSFAQKSKENGVSFQAMASLDADLGIDTMELVVLLSNTIENALNACLVQPDGAARAIQIKLRTVGKQLYLNVANTCEKIVPLDNETGLPRSVPDGKGHGIGLLSVHSFLQKYNAQVDCIQEHGWFHMRIVASGAIPSKEERKPVRRGKTSVFWINFGISALIIAGFVIAGVLSFRSFEELFKTDIEVVSSLTSENIYANINNLMERPLNVSITMAHDTLLQELIAEEAQEGISQAMTEKIQAYLTSYQQKYGFDSVFLVSSTTGAYYYYQSGISRIVSPDNPEDSWYFDYMKESTLDCKLNIDNNKAKDYGITIFVDCKLKDAEGTVLGVVGVGMETPYIQQLMKTSEDLYDLRAYLIDSQGNVQLSSDTTKLTRVNLFENPVFSEMADAIRENHDSTEEKWYSNGDLDGYIITKYIPNLNWYLVVDKNTAAFQQLLLRQLLTGLLLMAAVVIVVIFITNSILRRYHRTLVGQAEKDPLTGLRNRTSYEQEMRLYEGRMGDYRQFGIGIFDLNNLKRTNDVLGHQAGDEYLKAFAELLCEAFPHCPAFRIGGDEFLIVFLNVSETEIQEKGELLQQMLGYRSRESTIPNSAAFGYAFRNQDRLTDTEKIFKEADRRMYQNKDIQKKQQREANRDPRRST